MTYQNGKGTWDLDLGGEPVATVPQMLEWLQALDLDRASQQADVNLFLTLNARKVPDELFQALVAFAEEPQDGPVAPQEVPVAPEAPGLEEAPVQAESPQEPPQDAPGGHHDPESGEWVPD
jgi:hypothetical protein